jgi:ubiquinone biosynthesis protein
MRFATGKRAVTDQADGEAAPSVSAARRLAGIAAVLARYGAGELVQHLGLGRFVPGGAAPKAAAQEAPARLRGALQELGATFVKFGQMLSEREDVLPPAWCRELAKLQDRVPPFDPAEARRIVERELARPIAELYVEFEDAPLAAASVAQVHRAALNDGTPVVVKVQRPGVEGEVEADLEILGFLARRAERLAAWRRFDPVGIVQEFAESFRRELDFRVEARNAERFAANFRGEPAVYVPPPVAGLTARRVLTMAFSHGHRMLDAAAADPGQRARLAKLFVRLLLAQVFEHGLFHADPHPGNVFLLPDGRVCFHDFGMVGSLDAGERENLRALFIAVLANDPGWIADIYFDMGVAGEGVERERFARDLVQSVEGLHAASGRAGTGAEILRQFLRLGREHAIRLPARYVLVAKAFAETEAQALALDPGLDLLAEFREYLPRMARELLTPEVGSMGALATAYRALATVRTALREGPAYAVRVLRQLKDGELGLRVRHERLDGLERGLDEASRRVGFALVVSAVVIGSSLLATAHFGPHLEGVPLIGIAGFVIAAVIGLAWAVSALRPRKPRR